MLGLAGLGGVWLVSFLLVVANVAIVLLIVPGHGRWIPVTALLLALVAGPLWGAVQRAPIGAGSWRVAVVQPGVVHDAAARLRASEQLTQTVAGQHLDLVVWGESSVGFDLGSRPDLLLDLTALTEQVGAPVLVNVDARDAEGHIRKRAILIDPHGIRATYDKMRLVPFGEYIPLRNALGWLDLFTKAAPENRRRGNHLVVMQQGKVDFAPLICFESAFPDLSRNAVRDGADVIVVQTATTTFQGTWAADQHASLAALRAAETGRPVIQASLSGTSTVVTATGRQLLWLPSDRRGVAVVSVPLATRSTPYLRVGDWVLASAFVILGFALIIPGLTASRRQRDQLSAPMATRAQTQ